MVAIRKEYYNKVVEISKLDDETGSVVLTHLSRDYREPGKTTISLADTKSIEDAVRGGTE